MIFRVIFPVSIFLTTIFALYLIRFDFDHPTYLRKIFIGFVSKKYCINCWWFKNRRKKCLLPVVDNIITGAIELVEEDFTVLNKSSRCTFYNKSEGYILRKRQSIYKPWIRTRTVYKRENKIMIFIVKNISIIIFVFIFILALIIRSI